MKKRREAGVYVIWFPAGVYVGEAQNWNSRSTISLAETGGLLVDRLFQMPFSTSSQRRIVERGIADEFERSGYNVISRNTTRRLMEYSGTGGWAALPQAVRRRMSKVWSRTFWAGLTAKQRSDHVRKQWKTIRARQAKHD